MAILTVSRQFGSRGDEIAAELARRLDFKLVTRADIEARMRKDYGRVAPCPELPAKSNGKQEGNGRDHSAAEMSLYADLAAAIIADMAAVENLVLVGRGGQFLLRGAACAMHLRIVAPRAWRAATVAAAMNLAPPGAAVLVAREDAAQARYTRAVFGRSGQHSDLYHLTLNTAALDLNRVVELALLAVESTKLRETGPLSREAAERLKARSKMRLARRFAELPGSPLLNRVPFAHPSERVFARLMDFYGIEWEYEPRTFTLSWDEQHHPGEGFTPDFYLPEMDLYVELTTMKQSLVTRKNRKVKRLRELYPDVNIRVFYQKDVEDLLFTKVSSLAV